jgi:predicted Zn-dependent protease
MATGKRPGAVAMAEKTVALRPDSPAALDTLALALAAEGQPAKAAEAMRRALVYDERNAPTRLRLARYLVAAGDKSAAKTELKALAALGDRLPQQPQVEALLKTL